MAVEILFRQWSKKFKSISIADVNTGKVSWKIYITLGRFENEKYLSC